MDEHKLFEEPKDVIVRKDSSTDDRFGYYFDKRPIDVLIQNGVVNLNKPKGPTSHMVSGYVKLILHVDKCGHSGTLDPKVTGVLPVAIGNATRIVQMLLPAGKEYVAMMHLHEEVDELVLRKALNEFIGDITQLPPVRSAVKRKERTRKVYYLDVLEIDGQDVLFRVGCQAGTYIRKLCHDIGKKLGIGAHMAELIRTKAGPFDESTMVTLDDLRDAFYYYKAEKNELFLRHCIHPVESAIVHMHKIWVFDTAIEPICNGSALALPGIARLNSGISKGQNVALMSLKGELIGLGTTDMDSNSMLGDKGLAVRVHKVFMPRGTYPRISHPQ